MLKWFFGAGTYETKALKRGSRQRLLRERERAAAEIYTKQKALLSKKKMGRVEKRRACCESVGAEMKRFCSSDSNDARSAA